MKPAKALDPLTLSIIADRLDSFNIELGERILRQSFSYNAGHLRDLGAVLLDKKERMISIGTFMPAHTAGADIGLKAILDHIGRENILPEDLIIGNDPFIVRLGHVPDWSFVRPIFYQNELVFYQFFKSHQYDAGGAHMGAYHPALFDCHGEGLLIPPLKLMENGQTDEKVLSLILRNVRGAALMRADIMLVYASMKKVEERIIALLDAYGREAVVTACEELVDRTEAAVRKIISTWPAGTYRIERGIDWDGTTDRVIWVRLSLTIKPDEGKLIFDFSESDPQVDFINLCLGRAWVSVVAALAWTLPSDTPRNQGLVNCIEIITRPGSIIGPVYPATSGGQVVTANLVAECVLGVLGQAIPESTSAMWGRHLNPMFYGMRRDRIDPRTGVWQYYLMSTFHSDPGNGGIYGYDGTDGLGPYNDAGGVLKASVEVEEWEMPYRWLKDEFLTDGAGHGRWRGGLGTHIEMVNTYDPEKWRPHDAVVMTGNSEGEKFGALGLLGGTGGRGHQMGIIRKGKNIKLRTLSAASLHPGDILWTKSYGGGGFGDPLDRDIEAVRWDVLNEYISNRTAREIYGVVIDPKTFTVDVEATKALRKKKNVKKGRGE